MMALCSTNYPNPNGTNCWDFLFLSDKLQKALLFWIHQCKKVCLTFTHMFQRSRQLCTEHARGGRKRSSEVWMSCDAELLWQLSGSQGTCRLFLEESFSCQLSPSEQLRFTQLKWKTLTTTSLPIPGDPMTPRGLAGSCFKSQVAGIPGITWPHDSQTVTWKCFKKTVFLVFWDTSHKTSGRDLTFPIM